MCASKPQRFDLDHYNAMNTVGANLRDDSVKQRLSSLSTTAICSPENI